MAQQQAIPIYQGANSNETFYIPAFEIKMKGRGFPNDVLYDVMQVTYKDSINDIDSVELTINNWDAEKQRLKYVGLDQKDLKPEYRDLFNPGQELELRMGYRQPFASNSAQSQLKLMMVGQIVSLDPDFPNAGRPTLQVRALNSLHRFRKKQHTWTWENKRDSEIARELGQKPISDSRPGLGIEVRISDEYSNKEAPEPIVFMNNQYDILFLLERAQRHGYTLFLNEDPTGNQKPYLFFGPSNTDTLVSYKLEWGKSLMNFHPTLTTANQVSQITVQGWDRHTKQPIQGSAKWGDRDVNINLDYKSVLQDVTERHEVVVDRPVYTKKQAKEMAKDLLLNHLKEMIKASGATVGLPELRAGRKAQIAGLGERFNGTYFITDTTHTLGDDGYRTTFNARRENELQQ